MTAARNALGSRTRRQIACEPLWASLLMPHRQAHRRREGGKRDLMPARRRFPPLWSVWGLPGGLCEKMGMAFLRPSANDLPFASNRPRC